MTKGKYTGNLTKDEIKELDLERKERIEEAKAERLKGQQRRSRRGNRHVDWLEAVED